MKKKPLTKEKQIQYFLSQYFYIPNYEFLFASSEFGSNSYLRDILVFSHIQKIFSIRLLVQFYDFSEQQAWQYITASANIIQDCCSSWQDMGTKYVEGRELFLKFKHSDYENFDRSARQDLDSYTAMSGHNWSLYAWNTDLFSTQNEKKVV